MAVHTKNLADGPTHFRATPLPPKPHHSTGLLQITGDRQLYAIVVRLTVLTHYLWITITGEAGRSYLKAWLESLNVAEARRLPSAFSEWRAHLDVAIRHVVESWWFLGQESESLFDGFGK